MGLLLKTVQKLQLEQNAVAILVAKAWVDCRVAAPVTTLAAISFLGPTQDSGYDL